MRRNQFDIMQQDEKYANVRSRSDHATNGEIGAATVLTNDNKISRTNNKTASTDAADVFANDTFREADANLTLFSASRALHQNVTVACCCWREPVCASERQLTNVSLSTSEGSADASITACKSCVPKSSKTVFGTCRIWNCIVETSSPSSQPNQAVVQCSKDPTWSIALIVLLILFVKMLAFTTCLTGPTKVHNMARNCLAFLSNVFSSAWTRCSGRRRAQRKHKAAASNDDKLTSLNDANQRRSEKRATSVDSEARDRMPSRAQSRSSGCRRCLFCCCRQSEQRYIASNFDDYRYSSIGATASSCEVPLNGRRGESNLRERSNVELGLPTPASSCEISYADSATATQLQSSGLAAAQITKHDGNGLRTRGEANNESLLGIPVGDVGTSTNDGDADTLSSPACDSQLSEELRQLSAARSLISLHLNFPKCNLDEMDFRDFDYLDSSHSVLASARTLSNANSARSSYLEYEHKPGLQLR